jgi:CRP-like cAMP-binding protein
LQAALELPELISAIRSAKVQANTWLYLPHEKEWTKAGDIAELKMFFRKSGGPTTPSGTSSSSKLKTGELRRMKMFADMDEDQLELFLNYMEIMRVPQFSHVVRKGDHGDAMYLVLEGQLRALSIVDGKEATLSTMDIGESFGEISLLDQGPRSADVIANLESTLLKISAKSLEKLLKDAPQAAGPFLWAVSKSVGTRLRHLTKRYEDSIHFSRTATGGAQ